MFKREHAMRETYDILTEAAKEREAKEIELTEKKMKEKEDFYDAMNRIRKQRELEEANYENTSNALYDNHLQTVIEAVFVSAVQEVSSLTDDGIQIAHRLVENYIKENGGAKHIMESNAGKTYLLDFMFECVQKAHDTDMLTFLEAEEADEEEKKKAEEEVKEDSEKDNSDADENESGEDIKVGDADGDGKDDSEEVDNSEDESGEESGESKEGSDNGEGEESDGGDSEDKESDIVDELDKDDEESPSEDEGSEAGEAESSEEDKSDETDEKEDSADDGFSDADAPDPGMEDAESSTDEEFETKDSKEDMFEKLENDDTVASAVDVIAKRVADAEAEFIKKNAEDKQKIEAIADKIDERIKAVTDTDKSGEDKDTEQEELKQEATRMISDVRNDRTQSIFEYMINMNADAIIKDSVLKESYTLENGKLDVCRIEEATIVQYGFLEFLNTVQLENVNEEYIAKVLHKEI